MVSDVQSILKAKGSGSKKYFSKRIGPGLESFETDPMSEAGIDPQMGLVTVGGLVTVLGDWYR